VQFAVGFKIQGKTGHVVVDAEDALIAALKVKMQRPEALIAYVRQQNKRGGLRILARRSRCQVGTWPNGTALLIAMASHKSRTNWQSGGRLKRLSPLPGCTVSRCVW
jgi:hypothetical protein